MKCNAMQCNGMVWYGMVCMYVIYYIIYIWCIWINLMIMIVISSIYIYIWAIGKTSIEKCDLGAKLSFLGLHYIVSQYILIASSASPGKLHAESLFTPPLRVLGIFDCPALSFPALQLYGGCGVIPANATANHSCNKLWIQFVGGNPGELSQRHAPCLSFTRQRLRSKPSTWSNAFALAIFI